MTASALVCPRCGARFDEREAWVACRDCHALLDVEHDVSLGTSELRARFASRSALSSGSDGSGVWRYRELVLPGAVPDDIVSHGEGYTNLIAGDAVAEFAGVSELRLKHEGQNPTGSFKDRGMTVALTQAKRLGARAVACASTGNTSASLAAYAARAGLPALVLVPAGQVAAGKLSQTLAYGARTLLVRGDFDACLRLLRESAESLGVYVVNSVNPFRIEGQKTIVFELLEQLGWRAPEWIALPAGNLGNTAAFGKALREAKALGLIDRVPRLAAIQASGAAPFARAFADHFASHPTVKAETIASAIRIGDPASWDRGVRAITETNGVVAAVSDAEILEALRIVDRAGVGCEPASAASVAGVKSLVARGVIARGERVVCVLTGHVLKDPSVETGNAPEEIDASLGAIERVVRQSTA